MIMRPANSDAQRSRGASRLGEQGGSFRARACAAGFTIRLVPNGFMMGPPGGPRERFDTMEALVARLDEVEASKEQ